MSRPFFHFRIPELEAELEQRRNDPEFLRALVDELGLRSTDRARKLKAEATQALARAEASHRGPISTPMPENVTAELPDLKAIAADAEGLRYFKTLSDAQLQGETWGLIAAVLGNAANRGRFKRTFWWDGDVGFATYLAEAAGTPQLVEEIDPEAGVAQTRPPRIVSQENPPRSQEEALSRWRRARTTFLDSLERSRKNLADLERVRELAASLPALAREEAATAAAVSAAQEAEAEAKVAVEIASADLAEARGQAADAEEKLAEHDRAAPGFWARLFGTRRARDWRTARAPLAQAQRRTEAACSLISQALSAGEGRLRESAARRQAAERRRAEATERHAAARRHVATARERIGNGFIDADFFAREHAHRQKTAPWMNAAEQRARDEVFVTAMALHKAFIDGAARQLKNNLGALMSTFGGRALPTEEKNG